MPESPYHFQNFTCCISFQNDVQGEYLEGEILVETEPVRYELTGVELNRWRTRVTRDPRVLANYTMRNGAGKCLTL